MKKSDDSKVKSMVMVAIFATITFMGIQVFRIPVPAAVGTPFVHFGHIFVVMGVLLLGGKKGAIAGTMGLVIFDLLNGYVQDIPQVFIETIIKCFIIGILARELYKKADGNSSRELRGAMACAVLYAVMNIAIEYAMGIVKMMFLGSGFKAASAASITSIPATVINAAFMVAAIAAIYIPVKTIFLKVSGPE